jgi:hypothetical protein
VCSNKRNVNESRKRSFAANKLLMRFVITIVIAPVHSRCIGDQALPTSMDQLLQGIPIPGGSKNRQILRPSAARDPLTIEGEWRFILPRSEALIDFQQSIMFYTATSFRPRVIRKWRSYNSLQFLNSLVQRQQSRQRSRQRAARRRQTMMRVVHSSAWRVAASAIQC